MEPTAGFISRFNSIGHVPEESGLEMLQFRDEIHRLMSFPQENSSSFTALLELPATEAMDLLHSPDSVRDPTTAKHQPHSFHNSVSNSHRLHFRQFDDHLTFQTDRMTVDRAAKLPAIAGKSSIETPRSLPSDNQANSGNVKNELRMEPEESEALISDPTVENSKQRSAKRKIREKKGKGLTKKCKNESSEEDAEKLPYVHVRARRGQATDSHSLAERARREKINARMKLLQDLVPGCSTISGTTLVLDEIINHVQFLQRQVELLSMRLASVNPSFDSNLDIILGAELAQSEYIADDNLSSMPAEFPWPGILAGGDGQHRLRQQLLDWQQDGLNNQPGCEKGEENQNFLTPNHSFLTCDSAHSVEDGAIKTISNHM